MPDLITTRLKLKDVFPDLSKDYEDDVEFIRKGITPADLEVKEDERSIISYITTGAKDRDNEIVLPSGADLKDYRKNPVVLFGHNYSSLPIGKNMWIKSDEKGLIAKTQYASHSEADKVYQYRKDGFPLAESIGFIPIKTYYKKWTDGGREWGDGDLRILEQDYGLKAKDLKDVDAVYAKWLMLEYSDVAVPSNPEAMELAKSKGLVPKPTISDDAILNGDGSEPQELGEIKAIADESTAIKHAEDCDCEACVNVRKNLQIKESQNASGETTKQLEQLVLSFQDEIKSLKEALKLMQENMAEKEHKEHQEEYYSFELKDELKEAPDDLKDSDYLDIIKQSVTESMEEYQKSTLKDVLHTTKEVMDKMSGKVIQS